MPKCNEDQNENGTDFVNDLKKNISGEVRASSETILKLFSDPRFAEVKNIHKCNEYVIALHIADDSSTNSELNDDEYVVYIDLRDVVEARFKNVRTRLTSVNKNIFMGVIDIEFDSNNTRNHRFGFSSEYLYNNVKKFLNYEELDDFPPEG